MAFLHQDIIVNSSYIEIMDLNYSRNQFIKYEVSRSRVYGFEFRGKKVCITLYHDEEDTLYMRVDWNGQEEWYNEAMPILDDQCEELKRSTKLEKSEASPETGESKKELVSEEEFRKSFANPYAYGQYSPKPWPRSTILLYKYSSNATTKYLHIPENTWIRVDNDPGGTHAELIMIEDLGKIQDYLTIQPDDYEGCYKAILSVEVILSYSPCYKCASALRLIKIKMDEKVKQSKTRNLSQTSEVEDEEKVKLKITFSNFYKHTEGRYGKDGKDNIEGLKNLLRSGIKLDVFTDENWDYFFNAARLVTARPWRRRRERDDKKILQYLEGLVTYERTQADIADLQEMEEDLRKLHLL